MAAGSMMRSRGTVALLVSEKVLKKRKSALSRSLALSAQFAALQTASLAVGGTRSVVRLLEFAMRLRHEQFSLEWLAQQPRPEGDRNR
jgi:hypothetical protein